MTFVVSFQPDLEARLRAAAAAAGKDIVTLVQEAVEEKLAAGGASQQSSLDYQRWSEQFNAWMNEVKDRSTMYPPGYVADDSRESIYEDRACPEKGISTISVAPSENVGDRRSNERAERP